MLVFVLSAVAAIASEPTALHTPQPTALEQQQASLLVQRDSVDKQLSTIKPEITSHLQQKRSRSPRAETVSFIDPVFEPLDPPSFPLADALSPPVASLDCPAMSPLEADGLISSAARREDISANLLRAVIKRESAFRPCAVSNKGALGLMQLMPATAEQFGVDDPFNPRQNVLGGAAFLKQLLNRFGGDVRLALSAYNAGPERVEAAGGVPGIAETQEYVSSIASDLGLPPAPLPESAVTENPLAPPESLSTRTKEITNAMTQPDLKHLTLASPSLQFQTPVSPVHLISGR